MAYREHPCVTVICDGCETDFEHDYIPHFPDRAEADGFVRDVGGRAVDDKHWCEECVAEGKAPEVVA